MNIMEKPILDNQLVLSLSDAEKNLFKELYQYELLISLRKNKKKFSKSEFFKNIIKDYIDKNIEFKERLNNRQL